MMRRIYILGFSPLCVALVAACQSAPTTTETAPLAVAAPAEGAEVASTDVEVVCRSMKVTGTRFAKRECKTPDAWAAYDTYTTQNAKEATDKIQRLNTGSSMGGT